MSVISIGGGPRPQARIVTISEQTDAPGNWTTWKYAIVDGNEILATVCKLSHAQALLPLIQSGE
jgi:hypothetical protein